MNNFENRVTTFLVDYKHDIISDFSKANTQYEDLREINTQKGIEISQLLKDDSLHVFEAFKENTHALHDLESDMLYIQGFKDCIKLLKLFRLL